MTAEKRTNGEKRTKGKKGSKQEMWLKGLTHDECNEAWRLRERLENLVDQTYYRLSGDVSTLLAGADPDIKARLLDMFPRMLQDLAEHADYVVDHMVGSRSGPRHTAPFLLRPDPMDGQEA